MLKPILISIAVCIAAQHAAADMAIKYRHGKPLAIASLSTPKSCNSDSRATIVGRVIKREFDKSELRLLNFVYEERGGTRGVINIDFDEIEKNEGNPGMLEAAPAVETLTKVGRHFRADVFLCGAAGRVLLLENLS